MPEERRPETDAATDPLADGGENAPSEIPSPSDTPAAPPAASDPAEAEDTSELGDAPEQDDEAPEEGDAEPWIKLAAPYVQRLGKHLAREGLKNHSVSLPIGNQRVLVTPQEQKLVLGAAGEGDEPSRYLQLVRDGIGMQVGLLALLRSFVKAEKAQRGPLYKSLKDAIKAANFLAFEMHRHASELANSGSFDDARQCGEYRKNLLDTAERAQMVLGGDPTAFDLPTGAIATSRRRAQQTIQDAAEKSEKARARELAKRKQREAKERRRKQVMVMIAAACMVVLAVVLGWLWRQRPVNLEHFSANDFSRVPGFLTVAHREPSIIIVVDPNEWSKLDENQRRAAVQKVVDVVQTAGYREIEFRTQGRAGIAWWHKGKGVEISKK